MSDFKETCEEAIKNFQERLKEADNLKKDKNGNLDFESCWKAMRKEGPTILNVTKHLYTEYMKTYPVHSRSNEDER